jgi:hypothetical protein
MVQPDLHSERYRLWLLKNSISQNRAKKLCVRKLYKRLSEFSGHFVPPNSGCFGGNWTFSTPTPDSNNHHGTKRRFGVE